MNLRLATTIAALAALASPPSLAGGSKATVESGNGDWQWSLSGGPSWNYMGKLDFSGGSRSQSLALPSFVGESSRTVPLIGDASEAGERFYDNGFVRQDAGTGTDGSTWYWGYDNDRQVANGNLVYQATGFESFRSDDIRTAPGSRYSERMTGPGISLRADVTTPWVWGPFRVGGMIGLGIASDSNSYHFANHRTLQARADYRLDYVDKYALNGVVPPAAPYAANFEGPGPVISNIPTSRSLTPVLLFTDTAEFTNQVGARFDNDVFGVSFGGALEYQQTPWTLILASGLLLELHRYKASQYELLKVSSADGRAVFAEWSDKTTGVKVRPGLFLEAAARYEIEGGTFIDGFIRGEIANDFSVSAGPSKFEFEPMGFSIGLRIGRRF